MEYYSIGELCSITKGSTGIMKAVPGPYPLVTTGPDRKSSSDYEFDDEAVCIPLVSSTGHGHKSLNYIHYQSGKFALGTILAAVIPKDKSVLSAEYLQRYLFFFKDQLVVSLMKGAANVSLAVRDIAKIQVPVPPISKQKEFIELFNKAENGKLSLLHDNQNQFAYLTKLRQAILQEAIEGKLTVDWRKENHFRKGDPDFDAEALLEKIQAEKEKLIKEGNIKKQKPLAPIKAEEVPFDLPEGWVWTRLGNYSINKDGSRQPISQNQRDRREKIYPYYGASGIIDKIDDYTHEGKNLLIGEDGANLVARSTPIAFIADGKYWVNNHAHVIAFLTNYSLEYYEIHINAIDLKPYITGGFQPKLSQGNLNNITISTPPLAEQQAIVDRVEKLLSMVDELEKQVSERKEQSKQLMQAVLREAFEGGK